MLIEDKEYYRRAIEYLHRQVLVEVEIDCNSIQYDVELWWKYFLVKVKAYDNRIEVHKYDFDCYYYQMKISTWFDRHFSSKVSMLNMVSVERFDYWSMIIDKLLSDFVDDWTRNKLTNLNCSNNVVEVVEVMMMEWDRHVLRSVFRVGLVDVNEDDQRNGLFEVFED